uniref:Uncharacterized protein n=1 Tax=Timema tahoe TaxID=61484 RepID=A0A7R9NY72_9NEOP|nr:unnamed protein product [Timema tahoe]
MVIMSTPFKGTEAWWTNVKIFTKEIGNISMVLVSVGRMMEVEVPPELNESFLKSNENVDHEISKDSQVHLPYATHQPTMVYPNMESTTNHSDRDIDIAEKPSMMSNLGVKYERGPLSWMADYEHFDDAQLFDVSESVQSNYGTPDKSIPVSSVPCGGCGALLHCQVRHTDGEDEINQNQEES